MKRITRTEKRQELRAIIAKAIMTSQCAGFVYPMDIAFEVLNKLSIDYKLTKKSIFAEKV